MSMETIVSLCLGIGLAAACGFRIFVPFLVLNLASRADLVELTGSFAWMGSTPALVAFAAATVFEIGAYYIPWVDNLLDTVASPLAVVAGVLATASTITGMDPLLKWTLAVIAGGGAAGVVQAVTGVTRGASSVATGGAANFLVSTGEAVGSVMLSALSVFVPILALGLLLVFVLVAGRWSLARIGSTEIAAPSG